MPKNPNSSRLTSVPDAVYLQAMAEVEGIGCRTLTRLLKEVGNPRALWEAPESFLEFRLPQQKRESFLRRRDKGLQADWLETYHQLGIQVVGITDCGYPYLLKEISDPPLLLYIKGDISVLQSKTLAVVGTRHVSEYGRQVTERLIQDLNPHQVTIVSGLAQGVDTMAH